MREYAKYLAKYYVNFSCYFVFTTTLTYELQHKSWMYTFMNWT
jgi:hypothetical protein